MKHFHSRNRSGNRLLASQIVSDQQLVNSILLPEGTQSSESNATFVRNAKGCSFNQSSFTVVNGNTFYGEQLSLVRRIELITTVQKLTTFKWNKYGWSDFDQKTLRYLRTGSTNVVTMEMEPMSESTSRVKMYRIHYYRDKEDI